VAEHERGRVQLKENRMDEETDRNETPPSAEHQPSVANTNRPKKWVKGMASPNAAGRPRNPKNAAEVRELAREKTGAMLEFLTKTALNPKVSIGVRVTCATEILNRGWGKAPQSLDVNHGVQGDLAALLEQIDGRQVKVIEGAVIRPALEAQQPLLDNGQGWSEESELGTRKSSE
jgi:hypothetical protein